MNDFQIHTTETAPTDARALLEKSAQLYGGMVPNLHGVMAEAPALLEAYQELNRIFEATSLTTVEKNIVWLTINYANECTYCMAAHSAIAGFAGMKDADIQALRTGNALNDTKFESLRQFTALMVEKRGRASTADLNNLIQAGYSKQTALEVVLAIGMKILSNYTNHIADTPVDEGFRKHSWSK